MPLIIWPNATTVDLSGNPRLRFIERGMLTGLRLLRTLLLRGSGMQYVSPDLALDLPSLRVLDTDLEAVLNLAAGDSSALETAETAFSDVCCERNTTGWLLHGHGAPVYACRIGSSEYCAGCVFEQNVVYSLAGPIVQPIRASQARSSKPLMMRQC